MNTNGQMVTKETYTNLTNQTWDVVIIGGGLAGLTAAAVLSQRFHNVLLLEKGKRLGGRAQTHVSDGCFFNLGPHALYKKGEGMKVFKQLGIRLEGKSPKLNGKLTYKQQAYAFPVAPQSLLTNAFLKWKEKKELISTMLKINSLAVDMLGDVTLEEWAESNIEHEKVKQLLYVLCRLSTYSHAPQLVCAQHILNQVKTSFGGVLYLHGGWQTLIDQLVKKVSQQGVKVVTHTSVKHIDGEAPQLALQLSDDKVIHARAVIATTSPSDICNLIDSSITAKQKDAHQPTLKPDSLTVLAHQSRPGRPNRPTPFDTRLKEIVPIKGASLDIALRKLPNKTVHFAMDLEKPYYYSNHSHVAQLTNDPAHSVIHVFKYLAPNSTQSAEDIRGELEAYLDRLQPQWKKEVITSRYYPNLTVSHRLPQTGQAQWLEPLETGLRGFYVAGDWTESHSLLADAAIKSGYQIANKLIIEHTKNDVQLSGNRRAVQR